MKRLIQYFVITFVLLFVFFPSTSHAISVRSGDNITVPRDVIINETLIGTGQNVTVNGNVASDVFCAGQSLKVVGVVQGDVLCAGQTLRIEGTVNGDVRFAGQTLIIAGTVERNVAFLGQELIIEKNGRINGEIMSAGQSVNIMGVVSRDISGVMQDLYVTGTVNGKVDVESQKVTLADDALIKGNFSYRSPQKAEILDNATVSGRTNYKQIELQTQNKQASEFAKFFTLVWLVGQIMSLVSFTLFAILLAFFLPKLIQELVEGIKHDKISLFGWGLVVLFLTPILVIFLLFTLIGIPIAVLLGLIWIIALMLSKMLAGIYLGHEILSYNKKKTYKVSLPLASFVGVPVLWVITWIPIIGWLISFVAMTLGLGVLFVYFRRFIGR